MKQHKGFAVLTTAVLLSIASIVFTARMASIQLIDNKIVGNYYRNNEAFVNAESGINFILSKIDDPSIGPSVLKNIDIPYSSADHHYSVQLTRINDNTLEITSLGRSMDDSAQRSISQQIYHEMRFNLPGASVSSNGKLNLDSTATVNNGCEGVSVANCRSPGNFADYQLVSNPKNEIGKATDLCSGSVDAQEDVPAVDNTGINVIAENAFYEPITVDNSLEIGSVDAEGDVIGWSNNIPDGSSFFGEQVAADLQPGSLFESTFGVNKEVGIAALKSAYEVALIDMTSSLTTSCSSRLKALEQFNPEIDTVYITGNCDIDQSDTVQSATSENKRFTIGTVDNPKMVFIEGGTFITKPNTGASVIGMLYFLPGTSIDINGAEVEDLSVDMGGIRVNGATLSEYACSHDGYDKTDNNGTKQHFSSRYDKTVLNKLYENVGQQPPLDTGYSFVQGSWRDF
ncbi:pilus assembly PilX N-terminal domain-containing protein [Psychromonas sp.]|uniref:pilus assembly PilX N-terminal domain-containing protein n=1 Tax=Psychromonas sp. TaxID=1884585 RepID=UPI0039E54E6D